MPSSSQPSSSPPETPPHPWTAPGAAPPPPLRDQEEAGARPAGSAAPDAPHGAADAQGGASHPSAAPLISPASPTSSASASAARRRVSWRSVVIFGAVAYGLLALCAAPFWVLEGGIAHPLYTLVIGAGMFAPTIASVVVAKLVDRTSWRDAVGLRFRGKWKRILLWAPLAALIMFAINLATAVIMVLRGVPGDLTGSTWAAEISRAMAENGAEMPTAAAVALILGVTFLGMLLTVVPALGEEIGWRGWLWRELKPLGALPAIVLGGAIWSLWHLPITLIGHNYTGEPRWAAVAMFIPACIALNYLFVAITERAGGNPIPSAFAHSVLNSTLGLTLSVVATSDTVASLNWFVDTPLGLIGIVLTAAVAGAIMPRHARPDTGLPGAAAGHGDGEHAPAAPTAGG